MPRLKKDQKRRRAPLLILRQAFNKYGVLIQNLYQLGSQFYWHDVLGGMESLGEMPGIVYGNWQHRRNERKLGIWDGDFELNQN